MYYFTCKFEEQGAWLEAFQLLNEYGVTVQEFGTLPNGAAEPVPPKPKKKQEGKLIRRKGFSLKAGTKTTDKGLTPREVEVKNMALRFLKADTTGQIDRTKLTQLVGTEIGVDRSTLSPQFTALIRKGYLTEVK
jgi:hypothetical protein